MDKKRVVIALFFIVAVAGVIALLFLLQLNYVQVSNVARPPEGYLTLQGSGMTEIYLLNSSISYGFYERFGYEAPWDEHFVKPGDPCVIISGTIRNDGEETWIPLGANLFNANGEKVGTTVTYSAKPWFEAVAVENNGTGTFDIRVKYNKHDVSRYDIFLWWEPTAFPPP